VKLRLCSVVYEARLNNAPAREDRMMGANPHDSAFFRERKGGSRSSAEALLPVLLGKLEVRSIVDIGCGTGSWLAVAREG